jgi:adenosylhomocysteine nucleosidase
MASMNSKPGSIGLVVALEAELIHTLRAHPPKRTDECDGWRFHQFEIGGSPVVAIRSGMGLINAAAGAERLIAAYAPTAVINYGCAGAHRREIMPGDLVLGERVVHHSAMQILTDGSERYRGFGYDVGGEQMDATDLACDLTMVAVAGSLIETFRAEPWPDALFWPRTTPRRPPIVHCGVVASADIWTQAVERLDVLHERHKSLCEDMEAAAIAQVCARHGVPFLTVKDISNNEYLQPSDLDGFTDFPRAEIGKRAAAFVDAIVTKLADSRQPIAVSR